MPLYVLAISILFIISGCSELAFVSTFKQARPVTWKVLTDEEDPVMAYACNCDSFSMKTRLLDRGSWAMMGPPILPIFPIGLFLRSSSHAFHIDIEIKPTGDSFYIACPKIGIKVDAVDTLISPIDSFLVQNQFRRIKQEGLYHWKFPLGSLNYVYRFKLDHYPETFTIIFLEPYLGCQVPSITYVAESAVKYIPLYFPREH